MTGLVQLLPQDEHNQKLESNVRPPDWVNPEPSERYNLVVMGAGTAGLVAAAGAAGLGAKVALIERELLGGDCLNVGCVPSKALLSAARIAASVRDAAQFGVEVPAGARVNFAAVMDRMRRLRAGISPHDSAARFRDLGVDVYFGPARFADADTIVVGDKRLPFKKAVIATGARTAELPIPGLREAGYLTNESIFSLTELPARLAIIGGGPIGSEMAQCFARFGSQVTLIEQSAHILAREDCDAAERVQASLARDGVHLRLHSQVVGVEANGQGKTVQMESGGETSALEVDQVLVGIGRAANVEGMGLDEVGVQYDTSRGVVVNDKLQTSNSRIYAAGDVCSRYKFTHAADFMARIVIQNALFKGRAKASALTIPWCTYTSPELAHVGISEQTAMQRGTQIDTFVQELKDVDRAILEGEADGFVKVHVKKGTDRILGGTIVAANAGDMISELTLAMTNRIGLKKIGRTIHPYPTQGDAIRKVGDLYNRTRLTPLVKSIFEKWMSWTR